MSNVPHVPVLLQEVVNSFNSVDKGTFIDCTLGYAGHSIAMLDAYKNIKLLGIDQDNSAHLYCQEKLSPYEGRFQLIKGRFSDILPSLATRNVTAVLADFGVSSLQLDNPERGFSFNSDFLDMRMDTSAKLDAQRVVNQYSAKELEYIFKNYGEISRAKLLADSILKARTKEPITSAKVLSSIISQVLPKGGKIHPATLAFQAIRIEVNDELGEIERMLDSLETMASSNLTVSIITFHSLEDRLVKNRFRRWSNSCICPDLIMRCECGNNNSLGLTINKKPIIANHDEIKRNARSRSAKLRSFKFKGSS